MTNGSGPAFPPSGEAIKVKNALTGELIFDLMAQGGLTKREWYAGLAMQAVTQLPNPRLMTDYARDAVMLADALLKELSK